MPLLPRRLAFVLPPVVVAAAVGGILARAATGETERAAAEARIRSRWGVAAEFSLLEPEVRRFAEAYPDDPDARWIVAEAWTRMRRLPLAMDTVFRHRPTASDPRTPRRLARLFLSVLSWTPDPTPIPSLGYVRLCLARADAGEPEALDEIRGWIGKVDRDAIVGWFKAAGRADTHGKRELVAALRRRDAREFHIAAEALATGPKDRSGLPLMIEVLRSDWRNQRWPTWQQVARAVGASRTPEGEAALRQVRDEIADAEPRADSNRQALDVALALAGDANARAVVEQALADPAREDGESLYVAGLSTRLAQGDASAAEALAEAWRRATGPIVRLQIAYTTLLADERPPPAIPADEWAGTLLAGQDALGRAVGLAWRWRQRAPGALDPMVAELDRVVRSRPPEQMGSDATPDLAGALEILRAWYRW